MRGSTRHERRCHERGVSMVELAIVLPFLIMLVSSAFEYSRMIRVAELTSAIAREVSAVVLRDCIVALRNPDAGVDPDVAEDECVTASASSVNIGSIPELPDGAVVVSIYGMSGGSVALRRTATACNVTSTPPPFACDSIASRLDTTTVDTKYRALVSAASRIAVAEVFVNDVPFFPWVPTRAFLGGGLHYAVSIF